MKNFSTASISILLKFEPKHGHQTGVTLVELMVSLVLGLIMTGAVLQIYLSTSQTSRVTQGVSRIQENARFAHYFVTKDLREAGFGACINRVKNKLNGPADPHIPFVEPLLAWNYTGTESGNAAYELSDGETSPLLSTNASDWDRAIPTFMQGSVAKGSDILSFKTMQKLDIRLSNLNTALSPNLSTNGVHNIESNSILMVGDCPEVEAFQFIGASDSSIIAVPQSAGTPGNRPIPTGSSWSKAHGPASDLFSVVQTYYYIGEGASGLPSLFRFQTTLSTASITTAIFQANTEEVVEGIETLQVLLGEDTDLPVNGKANRYVSASQVSDWENIVSSRIGMLLRSPNSATDSDQADSYTLLDNISFDHAGTDNTLRYAVNSTVKTRNRGLSADVSVNICDPGSC